MPSALHSTWRKAFLCGSAFAIGTAFCATSPIAPPVPAESATPALPAQHPTVRPIEQLKVSATIHLAKTADWVAITNTAVWVGSTGPNAVHEIDPSTDRRVATVVLPGGPCSGLAVGFDSLWVPMCGRSGGLARIDLRTHSLVRTYKAGPVVPEGGVTTGAGAVWMVLQGGSLVRIDPSDGSVRPVAKLPVGSFNPYFSDGRIWITRAKGYETTSVDATTGAVLAHPTTGPHPRFLTAGGGAVWTLNQGDGSLSRIDISGSQPTYTLPLGTPGSGGDIAYGAGRVWTTFPKFPLSVVDASVPALLCQWTGPGGDSLGLGHDAIWLTNYDAGTISRIALADIPPDCNVTPSAKR